jgi:hypothetical protein
MKSSLSPAVRYQSGLHFSGEAAEVKAIEKSLESFKPEDFHKEYEHSSIHSEPKKIGFLGRLGLGMQNLGNLYSAGRLNTMTGKAMLAADVLFFMMSFVPLMHFMFLLQPSVIVFLMGAVFKKTLGHTPPKL